MKTKLGLLYGGKSAEHEVSLQTALAVIKALDLEKFDIHPIYITKEGTWVKGQQLTKPAESAAELVFSEENQVSPLALQRCKWSSSSRWGNWLRCDFPTSSWNKW